MTCLFFTALQGYDDWRVTYTYSNVCALRGSTVEISCTYKYPKEQDGRNTTVQKTLWFTKTDGDEYVDLRSDTDYADRVEYSSGENRCYIYGCYGKCTLRIRDLRLSDSAAEYKFQFITNQPDGKYTGDPGVTLSVTDLQVKVSLSLPYLSYRGRAGMSQYVWSSWSLQSGPGEDSLPSFHVLLKDTNISPLLQCVSPLHSALTSCQALQGNDDWGVTYTSSNVCALRGSTVEISCTYRYPKEQDGRYTTVQETLWFTKTDGDEYVDLRNDTDYADRVEYSCGENSCNSYRCYRTCTLRIRDLRLSDSAAEYKFQFITNQPGGNYTGDPGVTLSVTDPDLQVKVSFPYPYTHPTVAYLECHSMCGLAGPYIWTRRGQFVGRGRYYRFYIGSEDIFSCAVEGYELLPSPPVCKSTPQCTDIMPGSEITTFFYGQYGHAPETPSVTMRPSGEIEEGSSVTLSCSSDANPAAKYTWFKEHEDSVIESGQNYTITNITSELGGNYYCQAHNAIGRHNSAFLSISVTGNCSCVRKRASRKASALGPDTAEEPLPVYGNVLALTNRAAPAARREPIERQDDLHYASVSHSENQEVPRCSAGTRVQSDQTDEVLYSVVNAVPE
ncbi:B-cell receptor CD22 [Merluccius polli]|uniref:B-cell receptor CD22 n=1 Tax=Merluccius polli TaxID=89951 RepID=A0AA47NTQ9_MERPO|nr:B-cell receptor CD22 [Merluccius polli]